MPAFHALSAKQALSELKSDAEKGLSAGEAQKRLSQYGANELRKARRKTAAGLFFEQFKNVLILLLLVATAVSLLMGEFLDAAAMFSIVLLSAVLGFVQEYRAEKAMEALQKISAPHARVLRDGRECRILASELVPGDIILLEAGDIVPADSRVLEQSSLQIDEASLTGESVPSAKFREPMGEGTAIADQENMAFAGTVVTYGKGKAVVTATGMRTEFGKIALSIQQEGESKTPLQVKFEQMAAQIGLAVVVLVGLVFVAGLLRGSLSLSQMFLFSVSLAVAAVPSSLPAIVTISLAMGAGELARRKMIIRRLSAAESLGAVTVICSDKTGTITKNEMTVTNVFSNGREFQVTGSGYEAEGEFLDSSGRKASLPEMQLLLDIGLLCNNARLERRDGKWTVLGDPTEGALLVMAGKAGLNQENAAQRYRIVQELPFDSERKRMTVVVRAASGREKGRALAFVKGAPDIMLALCDRVLENGKIRRLSRKDRKKILGANDFFAENALRVLGMAFNDRVSSKPSVDNAEKNLVFVGLAGMIDPPREGVFEAVEKTREAGIKTIIITGDHALTTKAIAKKIGLFAEGDLVLTGEELDRMTDGKLAAIINEIRIFARTLPIQKSRIIDALKKKGHVVAMTGDGVNDAPALKKADVGISMGITGSDVAREVSKATLTDDNYATIVGAVSEGRNIYDKILKSSRYLLSCNAGEITIVFISLLLGFPLPLVPLQILLMNLLTDGLPALGMGFERAEEGVMKRPPRNPAERPLSSRMIALVLLFGIMMGVGSFFLFSTYLGEGVEKSRTVAFTTLVMFQMFAAVGSRSLYPFRMLNLLTNKWLLVGILLSIAIQLLVIYWPPLQPVFETVPLNAGDWAKILGVSSLGFVLMEASKFMLPFQNAGRRAVFNT